MSKILDMRNKRGEIWDRAKAFLDAHTSDTGLMSAEDTAAYERMEQDVVDLGPTLDELAHHRVELFLHRATQAAVGQFIELPRALAAVLVATDAAAAQNFAIDAELAELIDDDGDTPAVGIGENVAQ